MQGVVARACISKKANIAMLMKKEAKYVRTRIRNAKTLSAEKLFITCSCYITLI
jgi:hypothetical protein